MAIPANTTYVASYLAPRATTPSTSSYFASGVDNAPLHALRDGQDGANGVYLYGATPTLPDQHLRSRATTGSTSSSARRLPPDTTPPTVTSTSPAAGSSSAPVTGTARATFSEAIDSATVTGSSFTLTTSQGQAVPTSVSYTGSSRTATLTPSSPLAYGTSYTATVKGGASGVKDLSGNALASDVSWSFTTVSLNCPCSIWGTGGTPPPPPRPIPTRSSSASRFRSDVAGFITGIRFYKGPGNGGAHVGDLWTNSGTLLARVTFTGESASGWQTMTFAQPVAIQPNTTYVASYLAPVGRYAINQNYFRTQGADNGPLHALRTNVDGANGVYRYSATPAFPINTSQASNYWVDVVFSPS